MNRQRVLLAIYTIAALLVLVLSVSWGDIEGVLLFSLPAIIWFISLISIRVTGYGYVTPLAIGSEEKQTPKTLISQFIGCAAFLLIFALSALLVYETGERLVSGTTVDGYSGFPVFVLFSMLVSFGAAYSLLAWSLDAVPQSKIAAHVLAVHLAVLIGIIMAIIFFFLFWIVFFEFAEPGSI